MGVLEKLSRKSGVIVGDDVLRLFEYAQEQQFAIPAIVRLGLEPAAAADGDGRLTMGLERHVVFDGRGCARSGARPKLPRHPPGVPRWGSVLCRQGKPQESGKDDTTRKKERKRLTTPGRGQRRPKSVHRGLCRCGALHPQHCAGLRHPRCAAHRPLRQEAAAMARRHARRGRALLRAAWRAALLQPHD